MRKWPLQLLSLFLLCSALTAAVPESVPVLAPKPVRVFVIPIQDQVGSAVLYIVRRGLKEAISEQAEAVVFDMKTPGGALDTTFEIMEAIGKFPGVTLTYVNTEAISAGAFIAATTDEIWFAPSGIIGAAAPVSAGGQEVDTTMKQKIVSYLKARVRAMSEGKGYRGRVISAMIDADVELKIEDEVLKGKGELLSLTAAEALKTYGEPPQALLAAGQAKSIADLLAKKFEGRTTAVTTLELTWSERLAVWLNAVSPILLGIGLLALFIEFKTPGFGLFGITGIVCLGIVFLGNYAAGMSGHEPLLVFGAGLVLVAVEIFFFPGVAVMIIAGLALMFGSLIWSMADLWPNEPLSVAWSGDAFVAPFANLGLGVLIAVALGVILARFIPRGWVWDRLVLSAAVDATAQGESGPAAAEPSLLGARGLAVTDLRPGGQVEIAGRRYEAKVEVGAIDAGAPVVVRGHSDFGLIVERAES
jgi:membrane-bound serine protease (ClpP class)